jgi:hypothetical protein
LVVSDHLLVKAVFRVAAELRKKPNTESDILRRLDFNVLRPFCNSQNPVVDGLRREAVRFFYSPELADVPLCERGERVMTKATFETLAGKEKQSVDWCQSHRHKLDPLRDRVRVKMKSRMRQRKGKVVDARVQRKNEDAVRAHNKAKCCCKNVCIQRTLGQADASLNSKSWTKTGHDVVKARERGLSKPKKVHESAIRLQSGRLSQGPEEWLQAFRENLGDVFNTPRRVDRRMLGRLAPCCSRPSMEDLPTSRDIHVAVRRLKHSAGGVDGVKACMARSLLRDNDLFYGC